VRSATDLRTRAGFGAAGLGVVLALVGLLGNAHATTATVEQAGSRPSEAQVAAAVATLKQDPNLGTTKKSRRLRWAGNSDPSPGNTDIPGWLTWMRNLFAWLAETARLLLWVLGVLLVGVLGLYFKRFMESRGERAISIRLTAPSHVRDLDIRPESLPDDIGGAALDSWERGEHRSALALLYRGLLSRLAHVHAVPIRDSSTEGDCVELAARQLPVDRSAYVARLVRVWQRAVYGNSDPSTEELRLLCSGFSAAVDKATQTPFEGQAA
jgi:Domain of unknown function (DUF4129)